MAMDEEKKRKVMIGITVTCTLLAIIFFIAFGTGGGGLSSNIGRKGPVQLLCVNPDCEFDFTLDTDEYIAQRREREPEIPMGPMMVPIPLECTECGEDSAYVAIACKKCECVFMSEMGESDDYRDRCPECEYSEIEEAYNKRKKKK